MACYNKFRSLVLRQNHKPLLFGCIHQRTAVKCELVLDPVASASVHAPKNCYHTA